MTDVVVVQTSGGPVVEVTQQAAYVLTVSSTATQVIQIEAEGPQGPSGLPGPQGPQGEQGPPGDADISNLSLDGGNF